MSNTVKFYSVTKVQVNKELIGTICELNNGTFGFFPEESNRAIPSQVSRTEKELREKIAYMYEEEDSSFNVSKQKSKLTTF